MSMYNDIPWGEKGNTERCEHNLQTVANYARKFPRGHWSFLGPGSQEKWYGTCTDKPDGSWNQSAENMHDGKFIRIRSSNISCLQWPLKEENCEAKWGGKKSIHFKWKS